MARAASPPQTQPLTVSVAFVRGLLSGLRARQVDCSAWLQAAGITPALVDDEQARVTLGQYADLFRTLIDERDDELLGLFSRPSKKGSFALQVRAALGAPDLERAIKRIAHVFRLLHDDAHLVVLRQGTLFGVQLHFDQPASAANPFVHELVLRVYWRTLAWLVGGHLPPVRFDFAYPRPTYSQEGYSRIFPAPWTFDAAHSAMWFEAARLRTPVVRDAQDFADFIRQGQFNVLLPPREDKVGSRVRLYLQRMRPHWPGIEDTAAALHMSVSALQRHLGAEGSSFQLQKDQMRREVAIFRLHTSAVPLAQLAAELGFTDSAAFQRAFKRWTGNAPGSYRRPAAPRE